MQELILSFSEEWAIRALIASSLVGIMCGMIGSFIVLRNMSLIGDALAHAILPGIVVAFFLIGYSTIGFFLGSVLAGLLSALAITWIQHHVKTKNDAAIGIVFTAMFSLGVIGISYLNRSEGVHLDLKDFLFGTVLGISNEDLILTFIITLYTFISIVIFYRYLFITTFQPTIAQTMGISVKMVHYFLMLLLSFAVVSSLRTVGVILVVAMLITPAATALLLSNKLKIVVFISACIGLLSAVFGLIFAILLETTPGPSMCVTATLFYGLAVVFSPKKGLLFKFIRRNQQRRKIEKEDIIKQTLKYNSGKGVHLIELSKILNFPLSRLRRHSREMVRDGIAILEEEILSLTARGKGQGEALVRAHRLWETYLVDKIGVDQKNIHEEAEIYEHLLPEELLDEVDEDLGFPLRDPHGSPIPQKHVNIKHSLLNLNPKTIVTISRDQLNNSIMSELWELALVPGSTISVIKIEKDSLLVKHNDKEIRIPAILAKQINVDL